MKACLFLIAAMSVLFVLSATQVYAEDIHVTVNGEMLRFRDQMPVIREDRTLVPIRYVFEALGFEVQWDNYLQTATITRPGHMIIMTVGQRVFITNGTSYYLDVPAEIIGGRIMVPLRFPLESVGYSLTWNDYARTIEVYARNLTD